MKCKHVMTPHPSTCTPQATVQAAALIMSEEDVGIVPVVDPETNRLLGVVTDRDLCLDVVAAGKHTEVVRLREISKPTGRPRKPATDPARREVKHVGRCDGHFMS